MKKHLLSAAMLASFALGANAVNIDDVVFSTTAKYKVTGADLVVNGQFANLTDGWQSLDGTATAELFNLADGGGSIESASQFATTTGIYQAVQVPSAGDYVVTLKVKSASGGFTDIDLAGAGQNYISAVFSPEGNIDAESNVIVGQTASFGTEWTDLTFGFNLEQDGTVFIVLKNLASGVEISDVELHAAKELFDTRIAQRKLDVVETYLNGFSFTSSYEGYEDLVDAVNALKAAIENNSENDYETLVANLDGMWDLFLPNLTDVLYTINGAGKGNDCANWNEWTGKYNKLSEERQGVAGWNWSTDRWCHKTAEANSALQIQWMRGSSGGWDNIATNTCTLDKGTYFFQFEGSGGMMTLNKNWWTRSLAVECAETQMFFNNDTIDLGMLCPYDYRTYVHKFEVAEDGTELTFGIRCNIATAVTDGFDVTFMNPALYKVNIAGELTEEEKAYIKNVETQLDALKNKIAEAEGDNYLKSTAKPWSKSILTEGIAMANDTLVKYSAITEDEMIDAMYSDISLKDTIMNNGVRNLQNNYMKAFDAANAPLTDMPVAIQAARTTLGASIYDTGDKATFEATINSVESQYNTLFAATNDEKMEADLITLAELNEALNNATEAFKKSAEMTPIASFDFEVADAENPEARAYTKVVTKDEEGEELVSYEIMSKEGTAKFVFADGELADAAANAYGYAAGYEVALSQSPAINDGNVLVIGNIANLLELPAEAVPSDNDVLRIDFTMYFPAWGNSVGNPEFLLLNEAKETIGGFRRGTWNAVDYSSFGIDSEHFFSSNKNMNNGKLELKDCYAITGGSRVDYQFLVDFKAKQMLANVVVYKGDTNTMDVYSETFGEPVAFGEVQDAAKYISLQANHKGTAGRRASLDNLKIFKYTSTYTGVNDVNAEVKAANDNVKVVENGALVIKTAKGTFNAMGQQVK